MPRGRPAARTTRKTATTAARGPKKGGRRPPRRTPANLADMGRFEVKNKRPDLHYVYARPGSNGRHSVGGYRREGYHVVTYEAGGAIPAYMEHLADEFDLAPGKAIEADGFVLMAIPLEDDNAPMDYREIHDYGDSGSTGQAGADAIEARLREGVIGGEDPLGNLPDGIHGSTDISDLHGEIR